MNSSGADIKVSLFLSSHSFLREFGMCWAVCTEAGLLHCVREGNESQYGGDFRKAKEKVMYRKNEGTPSLYL
jgi:ATP-dependent 26S proteasome regulatory subunit